MSGFRGKAKAGRMRWSQDNACCHRDPSEAEILVEEVGFDRSETAILEVARFYWQTFAEPASQSWLFALHMSEQRFGDRQGGEIGLEILATVQAMRMSRKSCFRFNNPRCTGCAKFLSPHERLFMNVYIPLRDGKLGPALTHAMILCEGNSTDGLIDRMRHLANAVTGDRRHETAILH